MLTSAVVVACNATASMFRHSTNRHQRSLSFAYASLFLEIGEIRVSAELVKRRQQMQCTR